MYIPPPHEVVPTDPPVRVLSTAEVKGMSGYEAPNYVTGLAGAFLSQVSVEFLASSLGVEPVVTALAGPTSSQKLIPGRAPRLANLSSH